MLYKHKKVPFTTCVHFTVHIILLYTCTYAWIRVCIRSTVHGHYCSLVLYYSSQDQWTALHYASKGGHHDTVRVLLEKGADPNTCDEVHVSTCIQCTIWGSLVKWPNKEFCKGILWWFALPLTAHRHQCLLHMWAWSQRLLAHREPVPPAIAVSCRSMVCSL